MSAAPAPLWRNRELHAPLVRANSECDRHTGVPNRVPAARARAHALSSPGGVRCGGPDGAMARFALPAGALVDRWNRNRVMMLCSTGSGVALASIAVAYALGMLTIWQIIIVSFVEGTFGLVFGLAESSALLHVVTKEQLPTAVAQQHAQYSVAALVGPPLGGALYSISHLLPFLVNRYHTSCQRVRSASSARDSARVRTRPGGHCCATSLRVSIGSGGSHSFATWPSSRGVSTSRRVYR